MVEQTAHRAEKGVKYVFPRVRKSRGSLWVVLEPTS